MVSELQNFFLNATYSSLPYHILFLKPAKKKKKKKKKKENRKRKKKSRQKTNKKKKTEQKTNAYVTLPSWVDIPLTNLVTTTIGPTGLVAYRSSVLLPTLSNCRL